MVKLLKSINMLQLPGKKASGQMGWAIQAKIQCYLWLGLSKHKKDFLARIPKGYEDTRQLQNANKIQNVPPPSIRYVGR